MLTRSFKGPLAWLLVLAGCGDDPNPTAGAKFCNNLVSQRGPLTLGLEIGSPPVKLSAATGKCSAEKGATCAGITAGFIPWKLVYNGKTVRTGASEVMAGEEWIFVADLDRASMPDVFEDVLERGDCKDYDPFDG